MSRTTFLKINLLLFSLFLAGCGKSYDVETWRTVSLPQFTEFQEAELADRIQSIDQTRSNLNLTESRDQALSLVHDYPQNSEALWRAARAESDAVFLQHDHEKEQRSLAALSALEYAEKAANLSPKDADVQSWFAYSLGTTTHLQPMFSRASHARRTRDAAAKALEIQPDHPIANYTMALLHYRLQTLPGIAKVMSVGKPSSDLETANDHIDSAIKSIPSIENLLLKAKIQNALKNSDEARAILQEAEAQPDLYPRDREMRDALRLFSTELNEN